MNPFSARFRFQVIVRVQAKTGLREKWTAPSPIMIIKMTFATTTITVIMTINKTRTTRTPAFWGYPPPPPPPPPPHDYPFYWVILDPKSKEDKVKVTDLKNSPTFQFRNKHYTQHTFCWSCLIRCANMKWIRRVLLKQTDRRTRWNQYTPLPTSLSLKGGGV